MSRADPSRLSRELREGRGAHLKRRRRVLGLSLFGAAMGGVVSAYQMGLIRRLPDPPGLRGPNGPFDSEKVDASDYAYKRLDTPDGLLMLGTYAVTAGLAGAGSASRARDMPWLPIALAAKALYDVGTNLTLAREEWQENRALCTYCQSASLASIATAALALPEAIDALDTLLNDPSDGDRGLPAPSGQRSRSA